MFSLSFMCICIYCMLQLVFLIIMESKRRCSRSGKEPYFTLILVIMLCSFCADILSSLNRSSAWIFPFAAAGNYGEIILNTMMLPIYYLYVCMQISKINLKLKRRIRNSLWILAVSCSLIIISTAFTNQVFYFDEAKQYHRGPLFWLPMLILFVMMLIIEIFIINQRSKIEKSHYRSLIFFLILPLIGWALQLFVFGLPFALISATFAAQVVFTNIQNRSMDIDYLTGVFNRQSLDNRMQRKIELSNHRIFSAILMDVDNFKAINDCFGHYEGDIALMNTAEILKNSVGRDAFIGRYGGDEFCVILEEDNQSDLETVVERIKSNLQDFNKNSKKPYELMFSIGYALYDVSMGNTTELFFKTIDQNMYEEKKAHKEYERKQR